MLKKAKLIVFSAISLFLLTGCLPKKEVKVSYPNWYTSLQKDSTLFYYGTGEGYSKKEAVINALNDIASKVNISIESSISTNKVMTSGTYNRTIHQNIKNKVKKIDFSNYAIKQSKALDNGKIIVLVQVNRVKNAEIISDKISKEIKDINNILNTRFKNITYKLKEYNNIYSKIDKELLPKCFIAKSLSDNINIDSKIDKLLNIKKKVDSFKNSITFSIKSNNSKYTTALVNEISQKGYTINKKAKIKLVLNIKEEKKSILGNYIIKSVINITAKEGNSIISQDRIITGAKSRSNYTQAREFASKQFKTELSKKNILNKLLGI